MSESDGPVRPEIVWSPHETRSDLSILKERAASLATEQHEEESESRLAILLFGVGEEWYGVGIGSVREIYNEYVVTPIPCVPPQILGVINIRGEITSVTSLRTLLSLPGEAESSEVPVIVIENGDGSTALVVDVTGDIVEIAEDAIEPPVSVLDKGQAAFISGSVYVDGKLVGLLNLDQILAPIGAQD